MIWDILFSCFCRCVCTHKFIYVHLHQAKPWKKPAEPSKRGFWPVSVKNQGLVYNTRFLIKQLCHNPRKHQKPTKINRKPKSTHKTPVVQNWVFLPPHQTLFFLSKTCFTRTGRTFFFGWFWVDLGIYIYCVYIYSVYIYIYYIYIQYIYTMYIYIIYDIYIYSGYSSPL